jgi:protocatechuate 3,4-dioxygenase alpha subunit
MSTLGTTPSQTVGPYLSIGMTWKDGAYVVPEGTEGAVWIRGSVFDGNEEVIPDGMVEIWQADANGDFQHPDDPDYMPSDTFKGFGRSSTKENDEFAFHTIVPGTYTPYINVSVFARGMLNRVVTRIYFPHNAEFNAADDVFAAVPTERRRTLVATPTDDGYRFDIHLQGEQETVFFDV